MIDVFDIDLFEEMIVVFVVVVLDKVVFEGLEVKWFV